MMKNLNLCTDPWLPVRMCTGSCVRVSLEEFFLKAYEISDLILAAHERIAIMRLLICITQRAIDGPCDRDEWEECKDDIVSKSVPYLQQWRHAFNLLGENGAFLQPKGVEACNSSAWGSLSKISLSAAEGNNPTLFDNAAGSGRKFSLPQVAIDLITFQNFALCGLVGVALLNGRSLGTSKSHSASDAPCAPKSALHLFVYGSDMLETIWLNLCTVDDFRMFRVGMGLPVWEMMPQSIDDASAIQNATQTYLGRLVPMSRVVKISTDGESCIVAKGVEYPVYANKNELLYFESSMTITLDDDTRHIVGANLNKAIWRNLPALLHRFSTTGKMFSRLDETDLPDSYGVWVGALIRVDGKQKILGTMEDRFEHLGRNHVGVSADKVQADLMGLANRGMNSVKAAIEEYHIALNDPFENKKNVIQYAEGLYWGRLSSSRNVYLNALSMSKAEMAAFESCRDQWISEVCKAADDTFNLVASHDGVRQLSAWVRARQKLSTKRSLNK